MQIQYNISNIGDEDQRIVERLDDLFNSNLSRFTEKITRLEVHLTDENSHKDGQNDKRCMLEARIAGVQPIAVTSQASSFDEATKIASGKLKNKLDTIFDKLKN
ncbi:HPF/RaiA family ribosome-associated protein [Flavobacterium azooxidireducens]|uniref:HPF/RaiA family ribosome-associated protein n=1 Tax=Flavobacterium azooxidireducens TaxID=1871076 RepID=A0ABY4KJ77_9FLAO|nr:HPF/RaiA family ribosome-associated protein [Flavobacterium azooxidireducens]UPQ79798.1 HPF/RaiA family ribosome-associated protein [Flavobacterium azooxidireducens]